MCQHLANILTSAFSTIDGQRLQPVKKADVSSCENVTENKHACFMQRLYSVVVNTHHREGT